MAERASLDHLIQYKFSASLQSRNARAYSSARSIGFCSIGLVLVRVRVLLQPKMRSSKMKCNLGARAFVSCYLLCFILCKFKARSCLQTGPGCNSR